MKPSQSEFITLRTLRTHVRHWGTVGAPKLFLCHGWMDCSASFQFLVDALQNDWHVIALDWRGFGLTDQPTKYPGIDGYFFPDYLGDLEALLDHYAPNETINLVGHSMGANVVTLYAGIRPERIRRLVALEGFGLPDTVPQQAPKRYAKWLDELKAGTVLKDYASQEEVAKRLQKTNPRLSNERAAFLAEHWSEKNLAGRWVLRADAAHKQMNPQMYHLAESQACWAKITAPVLHVEALETDAHLWLAIKNQAFNMDEFRHRFDVIKHRTDAFVAKAGHMLHHDQPEQVAKLIEDFCLPL